MMKLIVAIHNFSKELRTARFICFSPLYVQKYKEERVTSQDAVRDLGVDDHMGRVTERGTGRAVPACTLDDTSLASM